MNRFRKTYEFIGKAENFIAGWLFVVIVCIIFVAGFGRSIGYPIRWAMDASTFLFAWAVFFSADITMRKDRHVNVEILVNRFPDKIKNYLTLLNYIIIIVFLFFLIVYGIKLCFITRFRAFQGIPGFSYTWVTLSIPIGCTSLLLTILLKIEHLIKSEKLQILGRK
ncbi:MAG: TRAP transporter small permease [Atribacterota bacterium]|nr:TRAP transporter small permease [Atribacterota bacterium]MDD4895996.1 TRAP transporter small permease [Atribacterota bacterium]MDD5637761.1 TRAP transporter small permease [Atribacterota bacterium]